MEENMIGKDITGYLLEEEIGRGSIGTVWRATNPLTKERVAIKNVPPQYLNRFEPEVLTQKRLEHDHIVLLKNALIVNNEGYIIMDYMEGGTLQKAIEAHKKPFSPEFVINLSLQVLDALAYAHSKDIIHCDIHPGNILFDKKLSENGWKAYLSDFGLAELMVEVTRTGYKHISLTYIDYMPPELSPKKQASRFFPQSDLYSWSTIMFELLTGGKIPDDVQTYKVRDVNPAVPEALEKIIMQGMAPDLEKRFPVKDGTSAAAMREALYKLTPEGGGGKASKIIEDYKSKISSILSRRVSSETLKPEDITNLFGTRDEAYTALKEYGIERSEEIEELVNQRRKGDAAIMKNVLKSYKKHERVRDNDERKRRAEELGELVKVAHAWGPSQRRSFWSQLVSWLVGR